ncbi:hypothetical protein [Burkholderia glumae]|uniref:GAP1-N1 domain-containing protein n=1 Tax=Burkholderia glumae TaxID=337 RepID=UPI0020CEA23E|nr:hypothetical protein [Burkholderia glumae]MCQ0034324.1 hypothetical protein [Burkholderia glumae]MCQ0038726.1 hypothetical protein [Burkholderia glumae]
MMPGRTIRIDQALHGYSKGHKELSTSIELDDQSRTTMLMMSDLLAVSDLRPNESYLTIYPLRSASRHVIARTWPAGRNFRPGSVWTHSLILDYQALALMDDLVGLRALFERPSEESSHLYLRPIKIDPGAPSGVTIAPDPRIGSALRQLYGSQPRRLVALAPATAERDEILTLALWRQMWPSLRRDFSALTNWGDRSASLDSGCTLRFTVSPTGIADESDPAVLDGLAKLEADLPAAGPTALRAFLGRYVIEAQEPRRVAAPLAALSADEGLSATERFKRLRQVTGGVQLPRFKRDVLTQEFARVETASDLISLVRDVRGEDFDFDTSHVVDIASVMSILELGELIAAVAPSGADQLGGLLFKAMVRDLPLERLASVAERGDRARMVELRPELLQVDRFWPEADAARANIIVGLAPDAFDLDTGLRIFGRSIGANTVSALMHNVSTLSNDTVVSLLKVDQGAVRAAIADWVIKSPGRLPEIAERRHELDRRAVETLAEAQVGGSSLPSEPGAWADLIIDGFGPAPSTIVALNAVGYLAALAIEGSRGLALACRVFDPLERSVRARALSRSEEGYLSRQLSSYSRSLSLGKALIRTALTKWPVTSSQAGAFDLTDSDAVRDEMVDEILIRYGRAGLEDILRLPSLPERAQARIQDRLTATKPKSKSSSNPWSWFFGE